MCVEKAWRSEMIQETGRVREALVALIVFFVVGCAAGMPGKVDFSGLPTRAASAEELATQVNRDGEQIRGVKGRLEMGLRKKPGEPIKRCRGMLLSRNGWHGADSAGLYLKGYKRLTPTFFTMVSDGTQFWFHIPRDNTVYTGPVEFSGGHHAEHEIPLDAGDLLRALFIRPVEREDRFEVQDEGPSYRVTIYGDGRLQRKLWIERRRFTVQREIYYYPDGAPQLEIERTEYVEANGHRYPGKVVLRDAASGSSIFLEFDSMTINPQVIRDKLFHFDMPAGVGIERIGQTDRSA
jgi:hypothetical protein